MEELTALNTLQKEYGETWLNELTSDSLVSLSTCESGQLKIDRKSKREREGERESEPYPPCIL